MDVLPANEFAATIAKMVGRHPRNRTFIAKEIGVSRSLVGHWCSGRRKPRLPTLARLLSVCGASDGERLAILQSCASGDTTVPAATRTARASVRKHAA